MIIDLKVGDKVYSYSVKQTGLIIKEGVITDQCNRGYIVEFEDSTWNIIERKYKVGTVTTGVRLWLTVRNDELAKNLLLKHEQDNISKLQETIERSKKRIELIKEFK